MKKYNIFDDYLNSNDAAEYTAIKSSDWKWTMAEDYPKDKNGIKVFSCFACGGGSTMGYKLAGCEVLGCLEIDPKMIEVYIKNHHPKYNFCMDIRDFNKLPDDKIPQELFNLDILDGSPPCFEAGTLVNTDVGYIPIEQVTTEHKVLTHNGRYMPVIDTMSKIAKEYVEVKLQGCFPIKVTPNHPFYVRKMARTGHRLTRTFGAPQWVAAKDLDVVKFKNGSIKLQHYVGIPIIQEQKIPEYSGYTATYKLFNRFNYTKTYKTLDLSSIDFWYFIGRWFGDGWCRDSRKEVILCCGKHEKSEMIDLLNKTGFTYMESEQTTTYRYTISNVELYNYMRQFGKGAANKHLTADILQLPIKQLTAFLDGYLSADGSYDSVHDAWNVSSISKALIFGVQQCIAKCYHQPTTMTVRSNVPNVICGRKVNTHIAYSLSFRKQSKAQQHYVYENGYLWVPFRKSTMVNQALPVYNLSVQDDESYTIYNYAVHNCTTFSMAGEREDSWGKKKKFREGQVEQTLDDLSFIFIDTVAKLKPKYVIMENVEGLLLGNAKQYVRKIYHQFEEIGYTVKHYLCKGEEMGVPQTRHRVFFIAARADMHFNFNRLNMVFNYTPIPYGDIKCGEFKPLTTDSLFYVIMQRAIAKDKSIADTRKRLGEKYSGFQSIYLRRNKVCPTIRANNNLLDIEEMAYLNGETIINAQTFPQDYQFLNNTTSEIVYTCGMSVPPVMIKRIMNRLIDAGAFKSN